MARVESGIVAARALADQVVGELDPSFWSHETTDPDAAADLADYVVGATQAVASNMQGLAVHFTNYAELRYSQDADIRMSMSTTGKPYPVGDGRPRYDERSLRMSTYERAIFVSIGSVLDTLAASLVGFAGLQLDIHRADFGWLLPMGDDDYPTKAKNKRLWKSLAEEGTEAREVQLKTVRAFAVALQQSGPDGWVDWALGMRNMFVHREHRPESVVVDRKNKSWSIDRVPVADPSLSSLSAFRTASELLDGYYLKEDVETTMSGLIGSLNAAVTGTIAVLTHLWERRKDDPTLLSQPSAQWKEHPGATTFQGYEPGSAVIRKGVSLLSNPQDVARLKAGGLLADERDL